MVKNAMRCLHQNMVGFSVFVAILICVMLPRFGWMDGVKRALNDRRMDIREASERARNRNEWRMIVTQF